MGKKGFYSPRLLQRRVWSEPMCCIYSAHCSLWVRTSHISLEANVVYCCCFIPYGAVAPDLVLVFKQHPLHSWLSGYFFLPPDANAVSNNSKAPMSEAEELKLKELKEKKKKEVRAWIGVLQCRLFSFFGFSDVTYKVLILKLKIHGSFHSSGRNTLLTSAGVPCLWLKCYTYTVGLKLWIYLMCKRYVFSSAWLCQQSSWYGTFVRRPSSVRRPCRNYLWT